MKIVVGDWRKGSFFYISGGNLAVAYFVIVWRRENLSIESVDLGEDIF